MGFVDGAYVLDHLRHYDIGELAREVTVGASREMTLVILGVEYAQRTDYVVVKPDTRIRMECQRHVYGDSLALLVGQAFRAAHEGVDPMRTRHVIVLVVVGTFLGRIYLFVETRPLEPIASPLAKTGIFAGKGFVLDGFVAQRWRYIARDIAVAAADLDGIGRNRTSPFSGDIRQRDKRAFPACGKGKIPQVYPHAAAHGLVHGETALAAEVVYRIYGIVGALGTVARVGYVYGVFAILGDGRTPLGAAPVARGDALHGARGPVSEWVFAVHVYIFLVGESYDVVAPRLCSVGLGVRCVVYPAVVVYDYFAELCVAFARQQYICSGIFEHRHQIRQHETLCE